MGRGAPPSRLHGPAPRLGEPILLETHLPPHECASRLRQTIEAGRMRGRVSPYAFCLHPGSRAAQPEAPVPLNVRGDLRSGLKGRTVAALTLREDPVPRSALYSLVAILAGVVVGLDRLFQGAGGDAQGLFWLSLPMLALLAAGYGWAARLHPAPEEGRNAVDTIREAIEAPRPGSTLMSTDSEA